MSKRKIGSTKIGTTNHYNPIFFSVNPLFVFFDKYLPCFLCILSCIYRKDASAVSKGIATASVHFRAVLSIMSLFCIMIVLTESGGKGWGLSSGIQMRLVTVAVDTENSCTLPAFLGIDRCHA